MPHLRQHILETRSGSAISVHEGTKQFIDRARGAPCTGELLPDADHGVAKLDPRQALLRYQAWVRAQLGAHF